ARGEGRASAADAALDLQVHAALAAAAAESRRVLLVEDVPEEVERIDPAVAGKLPVDVGPDLAALDLGRVERADACARDAVRLREDGVGPHLQSHAPEVDRRRT